jgi:DNA-binding transcriptional ArsR family regulator
MLEALFGNRTASAVLLFLGNNRDAYAAEIAKRTKLTLSLVQAQLRRLEAGGVLVSRQRGRMRFYTLNPSSPFTSALEAILRQAVDYVPAADREAYVTRRRPRMQGKAL